MVLYNMNNMHSVFPFNHLDDDSFNLVIYELSNGPVNFDEDRLSCLKFNPLLLDNHKNLDLSSDLDPDSNFFSDSFNCDYYIENSLNEMLVRTVQHSLIVYL